MLIFGLEFLESYHKEGLGSSRMEGGLSTRGSRHLSFEWPMWFTWQVPCPVQSRTEIRSLDTWDCSYHYLKHPDSVKEFYFVLIIDTEKPPWVLTRYRYNQNLIKGLTNPGLFKPPVDTSGLLSKGIGWLSWSQLKRIFEITIGQFRTSLEKKFLNDLILYLNYKIRAAKRIKNERKQLSFW